MQIQENVLLAPYTTFKIGGQARYFCIVKDQFDALEAYEFAQKHYNPNPPWVDNSRELSSGGD